MPSEFVEAILGGSEIESGGHRRSDRRVEISVDGSTIGLAVFEAGEDAADISVGLDALGALRLAKALARAAERTAG